MTSRGDAFDVGARRSEVRFVAEAASRIAAGFAANPETSGQDPRRIARDSFAIAAAILDWVHEWIAEEAKR